MFLELEAIVNGEVKCELERLQQGQEVDKEIKEFDRKK